MFLSLVWIKVISKMTWCFGDGVHSGKLTWNPKLVLCWCFLIFQLGAFRFHVCFGGVVPRKKTEQVWRRCLICVAKSSQFDGKTSTHWIGWKQASTCPTLYINLINFTSVSHYLIRSAKRYQIFQIIKWLQPTPNISSSPKKNMEAIVIQPTPPLCSLPSTPKPAPTSTESFLRQVLVVSGNSSKNLKVGLDYQNGQQKGVCFSRNSRILE